MLGGHLPDRLVLVSIAAKYRLVAQHTVGRALKQNVFVGLRGQTLLAIMPEESAPIINVKS